MISGKKPVDHNYYNTFITVAADCPVAQAAAPPAKQGEPSVAEIQYELISKQPYRFTQAEVLFEVYIRRVGEPLAALQARRGELWATLFSKPQACLRASPLPKRYGWGLHFDKAGKVALVAVESPQYQQFASGRDPSIKVVAAMRSKRA